MIDEWFQADYHERVRAVKFVTWRRRMPKKTRMFPGVTRQVVISDDTHQLLADVASAENKYIGELADELIRTALARRCTRNQTLHGRGSRGSLPQAHVTS
jgi:hypothetical protein